MHTLALLPLLASHALAEPSAPPEPPRPAPVVRMVARNYAFQIPSRLVGGTKRFRLVNGGTEPHYARFLRLEGGKTLADFVELRKQGRGSADWVTPAGGIAPVSPGDSADLVVSLGPGRYVVVCGYPGADRRPHVDHGMMAELTIGSPPRLPVSAPQAELTLRLADGALSWSAPPTAGRRTVLVENTGTQMHQALLARLPQGKSLADEKAWFEQGFRTERPGAPAGGVIELQPGERVWVTVDFVPGRYALLCHATPSHFEQNEAVEFTVR